MHIAGYNVVEAICEGTNTVLYRAFRASEQDSVMIKTLKTEHSSLEALAQLRHEFQILRSLQLAGVLKPLALEHYRNGLALIFADGGERSLLESVGALPLTLNQFLKIAIQLTEAIAQLHQHHILHKDIKPQNLLINPTTGHLKLINFEFATPASDDHLSNSQLWEGSAPPQLLQGTLAYMAPEQTGRMSQPIDHRTDLYALGVTCYELLTGQLPFATRDALELIHCHIAKTPIPPASLNSAIPPVVSNVVMKLLAKTAGDRYHSALGLKADLETCQAMLQTSGQVSNFAIAELDSRSQFSIPHTLYGRESEVAQLLGSFDRAKQGKTEMVVVSGYSGIGKSSLVYEVQRLIVRQSGYFIAGKFDQFKRNIPYTSFIQAFQTLMRQLLTEDDEQVARWRSHLLQALGSNGQVMIDVIPELERIIGAQPPVPQLDSSEAQNRFNRVFQQFIRVFSQPQNPLVVFFDDLQWADLASLSLIQRIVTDADSQNLLLIGAYRDHEVSPAHPLIHTLEQIQQNNVAIQTILLCPLNETHVNQLVADTLHGDRSTVQPFAELLFQKTQGNPFFLTQLLKSLYDDCLVTFDFNQGSWQWNMNTLQQIGITDNVVELMVGQIQKLSAATQTVLKLAACIGDKFTLDGLAIAHQHSSSDTAQDLWEALQAGLVLPLTQTNPLTSDSLSLNSPAIYKFLHDRVQQAAYSLIPDYQKQKTHFNIGQLLLQQATPEERRETIFDLVNHLNYGIDLLDSKPQQYELAELNLIAGQKAKAAAAYEPALRYLKLGLRLLPPDSWEERYELTLSLYGTLLETAYLNGDFEHMEQWAGVLLSHAHTAIDKMKVYEVNIQACMAQRKQLEAVNLGLQALRLLGMSLPDVPSDRDIQATVTYTATILADQNIEDLINLPLMTQLDKLAAVRMLTSMGSPTYQAAPTLFPLVVCEQVNLSIQYGNSPYSAYGYVCYGVILNGMTQDVELAYQFGKLALNLVERFNTLALKASVFFVAGACTMHGKVHARETLPWLLNGYHSGLENGQFEYGGYAAVQRCLHSYLIGQELARLEPEMKAISDTLAQLKQENTLMWNQIFHQAVLNLLTVSETGCELVGTAFDESQSLPLLEQANDRTGLHYFYLNKLILCYVFGHNQQAIANANQAEQYLDGVKAFLVVPIFHFYDSLAQLAIYPAHPPDQQSALLERVSCNQAKMQHWAEHAPMNFLHKYKLVEAEKAWALGCIVEAMELYDQAIAGARDSGYLQEEALANERAATFYFALRRDKIAKEYLSEAYYGYMRWGAAAKVQALEEQYPHLLGQYILGQSQPHDMAPQTTSKPLIAVRENSSETFDLATVIKASHVLSGEIVLDKLLTKFMQIVLENAGAEKGFLLLDKAGELDVAAVGTISVVGVNIDSSGTVIEDAVTSLYPTSIVNYVVRAQESIVLNNAADEGAFTLDPFVRHHRPKSILCTPILHQGKLTGALYLENNVMAGAFTAERLNLLQLLSSQAAIALENARLYADLEDANRTLEVKVKERTLELQDKNLHLQQEIRDRQRAEEVADAANRAKSEFLANMSHELRTPLNGILGYTQILKKDKTLTPTQKNGLDVIQHCGEHLLTLISDILDLSKIEARKMELSPHNVYFSEFLEGIVQMCRIRAEQKGIRFTYKPLAPLPNLIRADEKRLRQVLLNLLGNAVKFTETGGVTFTVNIIPPAEAIEPLDSSGVSVPKIRFQIEDTGIGITPGHLQDIFLPFRQVSEPHKQTEGTGLGLAISRQLVQLMNSEIHVRSTPGRGSTFWLDLDLTVATHQADEVLNRPSVSGYRGDRRTILVVDDKEENRFVLTHLLQPLGFKVVEAVNGRDALHQACQLQPDAILVDLVMPVMDGFEMTRQIRLLPELQHTVIIATSASVFEMDQQQSREVGCNDFLSKPVQEAELLKQLSHHLHLEWIYELTPATEAIAPPFNLSSATSDLSATLVVPPAEEIAILLDLAMMGDLKGILDRSHQLEALDPQWIPFAAHLRQLAKGFKERQILEFIRQCQRSA
ncbi:AAA family ATPase [Oscillatoria sp. FACHB-1407]|uniref:hybrid sensor histidine kinase/response regulator n=1 Tax=Oscillatoria sp. FACHB-1407 TaxID=2692847 RepID=UPI00168229F1|nr:hybrid sensor histidine kinase/response regulator [Oscillatoria sp. FACHB-1407]MBD2465085.1 AAA family ATPase [Oscillatoria sp. FACHB-1407]